MCWNENVSLNTFIFGTLVLLFIAYNNAYTQYKIVEFKECPILYLFIFSIVSMQLVEFFLWKSIRNKNESMNRIFSMAGWGLLRILQPLFGILLIPAKFITYQYLALFVYFFILAGVSFYKQNFNSISWKTTVDKNGHLQWSWAFLKDYEKILALLYFLSVFMLVFHFPIITILALVYLMASFFSYKNSWGSMWCWISNSFFIYFLVDILFLMPYKEYTPLKI